MAWTPREAGTVWGEDFADDGWAEITGARDWSTVHPDEFIRFFPGLPRPASMALVPPLHDHLRDAVRPRKPAPATASAIAMPRLGRLFGGLTPGRGRFVTAHATDGSSALAVLAPILDAFARGEMPAFSETQALGLAFHGGVHPAYLWPAAVPIADVATAAGWLGLVRRGRPAHLPYDIAVTLHDTVGHLLGNQGGLRDRRLTFCGFKPAQWAAIAEAAQRRLDGRRDVVRLEGLTRWRPALFRPAALSHIVAGATSS